MRFFLQARGPTRDELQGLLDKIIARLLKRLARRGTLVQEQGMTYLADMDADNPLASLQAASCTYRIAPGPRATARTGAAAGAVPGGLTLKARTVLQRGR